MIKNSIKKCFLALGLLLFLTLLLPFSAYNISTAKAASVEVGEKNVYSLNIYKLPLVKGKTFTLKVNNSEKAKVSFKSDDQEIASVTDEGVITANKIGTTIITVTVKDSNGIQPLTAEITVGPPALSIKQTRSRIIIGKSSSDFLRVILKPSNTVENARFSSNDSLIVSVSAGGRITARDYGFTNVFALIEAAGIDGNQKNSKCSVIVTSPELVSEYETYFNDHPELNLISEPDLDKAMSEFFNVNFGKTLTSVDSFNNFLDEKFDLGKYREVWEEALPKITDNITEVVLSKIS